MSCGHCLISADTGAMSSEAFGTSGIDNRAHCWRFGACSGDAAAAAQFADQVHRIFHEFFLARHIARVAEIRSSIRNRYSGIVKVTSWSSIPARP
jgi:hypothetical protein